MYKKLAFNEYELMQVASGFFLLEHEVKPLRIRFCTGIAKNYVFTEKDFSLLEMFVFDALFHAILNKFKPMQRFFDALHGELYKLEKFNSHLVQSKHLSRWIENNIDLRNTIINFYLDREHKASFDIADWKR